MKTVAIIQARMSSSRLPGKVMADIMGKPLLWHMARRVARARSIDMVAVATSIDGEDDAIATLCKQERIPCFRGSLDDVLDRFYKAALHYEANICVRLTADCPLIDPEVADRVISAFKAGDLDYMSNAIEPTFPDGLDTEVFRMGALTAAWSEATIKSEREHVTPFIRNHPERFRVANFKNSRDLSAMRWTVDEEPDLAFVRKVYEALYPGNPSFSMDDILALLKERPELYTMNRHISRNEGFRKSVAEDRPVNGTGITLTKSLGMQERAKKRIPGMTQLLSKRPDLFSMGVWPGYFSRASGVEVWDLDGNRYVDMSIGGIGANVLGYADPDVDAAVMAAVRQGSSSSLNCPEEVFLAELLCELHPWAQKVRFARTGGESMAIAVRIARAATGRDKVAFCGYHGWHDWYLAANVGTENALGEHLLPGLDPAGVPRALAGTAIPFRYNQPEEISAIMAGQGKDVAAIVMEPIRNDRPDPGYFDGIRRLADANGAVLIIDEISAGFRMNTGGAHLELGIQPDIAVFSKALGNGYPIGAIIGREGVMDAAQKTFISSTYWTERIGPAAALAMIGKHRRTNAGAHLMAVGERIQAGWKAIAARHGLSIDIGGIPPLSHFSFTDSGQAVRKALFVQWMLEKGYLASTSFYSMLAHEDEHVEGYLAAADLVFDRIAEVCREGSPEKYLKGNPAVAGFKRLN